MVQFHLSLRKNLAQFLCFWYFLSGLFTSVCNMAIKDTFYLIKPFFCGENSLIQTHFCRRKSQSRCNDAAARSCPALGASLALRVFHWRTLGAVRGAEGTAAALPRGGGSQLRARSGGGGGSTVLSLHSAESELPPVVVSDPESREPPVTVSESVKTSEPGRKSGRRWRRGGAALSVCAARVRRSSVFQPASGKSVDPKDGH